MDVSALLFGAAMHWGSPKPNEGVDKYNDINPGIGIKLATTLDDDEYNDCVQVTFCTGSYLNSVKRQSNFFGPGFKIGYNYGAEASIVHLTGYINNPLPIAPIIGVYYSPTERVTLHAAYMVDGVGFYGELKIN